jgi:glycosyltransferase involved in cell wall biosynthesis
MQLVYLSPIPAKSYAQRPHYMVRSWLAMGAESVLWVEPYPTRLPRASDFARRPKAHDQGTMLDSRVEVLRIPAMPFEPLPGGTAINRSLLWRSAWRRIESFAAEGNTILGIGKPSALALHALEEIDFAGSFFDAMDNFPEFHRGWSRRAVARTEAAIAERVDWVLASSTYLEEKFARRWLPVKKVLNGYAMESLPDVAPRLDRGSPREKIVLGYVGCLGPWLDWALVRRLAESLPAAAIELIGPLASAAPRLPANVRLLPPCPQHEVAGHLARFDAGLIPFRSDRLTDGVDPIKYYEYRAAGLPVLSTRFGEMANRTVADGVVFLDDRVGTATAVQTALESRADDTEIRRFRRAHDWSERFERSGVFRVFWEDRLRRAA